MDLIEYSTGAYGIITDSYADVHDDATDWVSAFQTLNVSSNKQQFLVSCTTRFPESHHLRFSKFLLSVMHE